MSETPPTSTERPWWCLGEDWAATITGFALLGLALVSITPAGLIP